MIAARRRSTATTAALAAALAFASLAAPVRAGVFDQDAIKRVDATDQRLAQIQHDLDARLAAIEQQMKSQGLADLFNQLEHLTSSRAAPSWRSLSLIT